MLAQRLVFASLMTVTGCTGDILGPSVVPQPSPTGGACTVQSPGHVPIHRLTRAEYDHTVADLLYTQSHPASAFDPDRIGVSGFSNDSDGLPVSDDLTTAWYGAAEQLSAEFLASKGKPGGAYGRLVTCVPSMACAQTTLTSLASRAFRRPVTADELAALMQVYGASGDFDTGLSDALIALLMSPKFMFVSATGPASQDPSASWGLDDYALASRLSYGLWQTMPDDALLSLAEAGQLHDPVTLKAQVARMLADAGRMRGFLETFRDDWVGLQSLASPTASLMGLDDATRLAMVGEADAFLSDLVQNDRSLLTLLTARTSFVNGAMAAYYGMSFPGSDPSEFVPMALPANRRGLVLSPAVLTVTALDVNFTHPVHRGKWAVRYVLCAAPPPAPPGIPALNPDPAKGGTPREKLAQHTASPTCNACHAVMDTVGLGLENYDPFGRWRDTYGAGGAAIDPSGTLPDGESFTTPTQMYDDLAEDAQARACLASGMMAYLLTRAMASPDDACAAEQLAAAHVTPDSHFSELVAAIAQSPQFLTQTGEAP
jgi:hypothetical protein